MKNLLMLVGLGAILTNICIANTFIVTNSIDNTTTVSAEGSNHIPYIIGYVAPESIGIFPSANQYEYIVNFNNPDYGIATVWQTNANSLSIYSSPTNWPEFPVAYKFKLSKESSEQSNHICNITATFESNGSYKSYTASNCDSYSIIPNTQYNVLQISNAEKSAFNYVVIQPVLPTEKSD